MLPARHDDDDDDIYIYIYTRFVFEYFVGNILKMPQLICWHLVEWFQVFLCNTNTSI